MADFCKAVFAIFAILGGLIGGGLLLITVFGSMSAPQQAAAAAIAVGLPVIPYCIARSFEMLEDR